MIKITRIALLCCTASLFAISALSAQCPTLVWSDEFDGTSLDQSNWNYQTGTGCDINLCGWGNNELQHYQESNVTVSNGVLKITAKKERVRGSQYTSGRINTKGKADFTFGRLEARIKLPAGGGLWPAFWMLSTNEPYGGWPQSGEIDIMEFVGHEPDRVLGTIHYGDPYPNNQYQGNSFVLQNGNFYDDYHEFAIEWEATEIRWYMDGILYSVKTPADIAPYSWPFDHDFHFLLNVAVGGNLGGTVDNSIFPATMEVDYVRVYDGFKPYIDGNRVVANAATGEVYSVGNVANNASVTWSVPAGATITSGQGSTSITVDWGTQGGTVTAAVSTACGSEQFALDVEVEAPYVYEYSFENFDDPATATLDTYTGTYAEVANPAPNALNSSSLVGQYTRNSGEQYDVLVYGVNTVTDASLYVNKDKKFFVDVYTSAPIGTDLLLQLETSAATPTNYPTGRHSRYVATVSENNNWHRLEFRLLDRPDTGADPADVSSLILLFNSNTFTGDTYYYDNLDNYTVDTGTPTNQPPTVSITSPNDGATFTANTSITVAATASDSDGSVTQVEFFANGQSISTDANSPYSVAWTVPAGANSLTAIATDNDGATTTSAVVSVTGQAGGAATECRVAAIVTGTASAGQGNKRGTAEITIVDNLGNPVASATVSGAFSGTFTESASGTTNANGVVNFTTSATAKGGVTVDFCVTDVQHATLVYNSGTNTITCTGGAALSPQHGIDFTVSSGLLADERVRVYPNPAADRLAVHLQLTVAGAVHLQVFDLAGRLVSEKPATVLPAGNQRIEIELPPAAGTYLLRTIYDGQITDTRIVKQ